ncbi:MAG: hypothetical protein R3F14_33210 [Polyangiaceae bacterium]
MVYGEARLEKARQAALAKPELKPAGAWAGPPLVPDNGMAKGGNAVLALQKAGVCEDSFPPGEVRVFDLENGQYLGGFVAPEVGSQAELRAVGAVQVWDQWLVPSWP